MQTPRNTPKKGIKFLDAKVFIAASSIAVTVGLWNVFSHGALLDQIASQKPVQAAPADPSVAAGQGLPPLPTLVPLINVTAAQGSQAAALPAGQSQPNTSNLRSVTAPDQVIVQKVKPVFEQTGGVVVIGGGGGGGGGGSSAPRARSSHP